MPKRLELSEGQCLEIGGVPVGVAFARDKRAVILVGTFDQDGLAEGLDDVRAATRRYRDKIDKARGGGNTSI